MRGTTILVKFTISRNKYFVFEKTYLTFSSVFSFLQKSTLNNKFKYKIMIWGDNHKVTSHQHMHACMYGYIFRVEKYSCKHQREIF